MDNLISRQAAIDALMEWEESSVWDEDCIKHRGEPYWVAPSDVIEQLPSAQPEILACGEGELSAQPEVIRCEDCKYNRECAIQFVANADDKFFCGAGER